MIPGIIKSAAEHARMLAEIESLAKRDPEPGSQEGDRLELLVVLVQEYENRTNERALPDPIEAILFRMEQQNLSARDLIPYIGSRSKVSEVLARKRPLTLAMIRALHTGLGIPAAVLLHTGMSDGVHVRAARSMDRQALAAWTDRVVLKADADRPPVRYKPGTVDLGFIREVARLSWSDRGPLLAREYLGKHGISLIVEPHPPGVHLDGAAIMARPDHPIVGMTLRFDRIDNFWATLAHELAHLALHDRGAMTLFYDDLETEANDPSEQGADELAREALIPREAWEQADASSATAAAELARQLRIHPAIIAGRVREEQRTYRALNNLVGHHGVRHWFPDIPWDNHRSRRSKHTGIHGR